MNGRVAEYELRVRWGETDAFGIVFYPTFYAWMDQATHELFRTDTTAFVDLFERASLGLPIIEASCRFSHPARYDDVITVISRVTEIRSRTFQIDHTFERAGSQIAGGREVRAFVRVDPDDPKRLNAETMPEQFVAYLSGTAITPL